MEIRQDAREYAASVEDLLISDNDAPTGLRLLAAERKQQILDGKLDNNFTILQRMHFFMTGEDVPLLPK